MHSLWFLFCFVTVALAACRTTAPPGALVVSKNGTGGYRTIQAAVDALSSSAVKEQSIFIGAGTYKEQVYVPKLKGPLSILGYTVDESTYKKNVVFIEAGESQETQPNNDATATLRVHTSNFKLYNVNVVNSYGEGSQALALSANAAGQGYYGCSFTGFQDTVLAERGAQLYARSYIEGATDFIFGQYGEAWFDQCDIRVLQASKGYITASGRKTSDSPSYLVINNSTVAAAAGNTVESGAYYLGRPWGQYARVAFQSTDMTAVVNPAGWSIWNKGDARTENSQLGEHGNTGAGSKGARASFGDKLSKPVAIADILGTDYESVSWMDLRYLG